MTIPDPLPPGNGGKKAFYADPVCPPAVLPVDVAAIAALKKADRWVLWRLVWKANRDGGSWAKVPVALDGRAVDATCPANWLTFDHALAVYRAGGFAGVGFALGDGYVGIDLDGVRDRETGEITAGWAAELIATAGTYADVSPSGTGVKVFGRGVWRGDWHKRPHPSGAGEVEVYDGGRFFTVTGHPADGGADVADIQPTLDTLATLFDAKRPDDTPLPPPGRCGGGCPLSDDELLDHIRRSKQGGKFARLFDRGDAGEYGGDDSRADLGLCSILAFWVGPDAGRIDRLLRQSALMRGKWDSRRKDSTYGKWTIDRAVAGRTEFYDWTRPRAEFSGHAPKGATPPPPAPPPPVPAYRPFPVHALPPVLREFVVEVAHSVDCDPAFAALPALVVAGAAVGSALVVRPKRGYEQPPLLWLCTVGDSGTGKSPALKPAADRAFCIDRMLKEAFQAALRKYKADLEAWEAAENPDPDAKPARPVRERFAVIDATIERLTVESTTSPRGLVVVRDELDGWFGGFARYKGKAGGSDVPNWLSMYEAGPVRYMRRTGEPREVEADRAFVAVCGGIQPDILKATLSDPAFLASGMAARLGFAMPPKACPRWSDRELSCDTERAFADVLDRLRALPFDPQNGPGRVNLDAAALERFKRLNDEFAATAEDLDGGPMAAVLPKAVRFALRLALVWWCVREAAEGRDPGVGSVGDEAMAAGEELARWFVHEAERVYAVLAELPEQRGERTLAEWVRRKGGRVRPRQLQRSNGRRYPTTAAAEAALDGLVSAGFGEWEDEDPRPGGGWAGRVFVLHPLSDARHSLTLDPDDVPPPDPDPSDTRPPASGGEADISAEWDQVSASVGRRTTGDGADRDRSDVPTAAEHVSDAPPAWDDPDGFHQLLTRAGWGWADVLRWLKASPTSGFYDVPAADRQRAADHLARLATERQFGGRG